MIILEISGTKKHYIDVLRHKALQKLPRFRRSQLTGLYVRDMALEIVRTKFRGIPDLKAAREVYYPSPWALFVYHNLIAYLKAQEQP